MLIARVFVGVDWVFFQVVSPDHICHLLVQMVDSSRLME